MSASAQGLEEKGDQCNEDAHQRDDQPELAQAS
jgi:hypothetical protein